MKVKNMKLEDYKELNRAKTKLVMAHRWWAALFLRLKIVIDDKMEFAMGVDGTHLYVNPELCKKFSIREMVAVLAHEAAHCALLHVYRRKARDPMTWNIACDMLVNAILEEDGIVMPANCIPPTDDLGKTVEEIYEELLKKGSKTKGGGSIRVDQVSGSMMKDLIDARASSSEKGKPGMTERDWKDAVAQSYGSAPASLRKTIPEHQKSNKDWVEELARFIADMRKSPWHTWRKVSRRLGDGFPGWKKEPQVKIAICIDTSGSCWDNPIQAKFLGEAKGLLDINGVTAHLIACDAKVQQVINPGAPFPKSIKGGGGTDFTPALDKAAELKVNGVIYLTDCVGSFPPDYHLPVLWAVLPGYKNHAPFGDEIILE